MNGMLLAPLLFVVHQVGLMTIDWMRVWDGIWEGIGWLSTPQHWSALVALFALAVSLWTKSGVNKETRERWRIEKIRRLGSAFVSAQAVKNKLGDGIEILEALMKKVRKDGVGGKTLEELEKTEKRMNHDYAAVWDLIRAFEENLMNIERGKERKIDLAKIEAKIARFEQLALLTAYDIETLKRGDFEEKVYDLLAIERALKHMEGMRVPVGSEQSGKSGKSGDHSP